MNFNQAEGKTMTFNIHIRPAAPPVMLDRLRETIGLHGSGAAQSEATRVDGRQTPRDALYYVPFEHINRAARLVIVGITPGPNQIKLAYQAAQMRIKGGMDDATLLARVKEHGAFGGPQMKPNLLKMLTKFRFAELLGIGNPGDLWGSAAHMFHATSVVPHAAFRGGKKFAGSFDDVMQSPTFRESFLRDFAAGLPLISSEARYVALGPTPLAALDWCVAQGLVRGDQILGAFAHPSSTGGSEVPVYLGEKTLDELKPRDPVRHRIWLPGDAQRMAASVEEWRGQAKAA
jgi:hypothetical protein